MVPTGDFELAGVPELNEYGGRRSVRIKVLDWRPVEPLKR